MNEDLLNDTNEFETMEESNVNAEIVETTVENTNSEPIDVTETHSLEDVEETPEDAVVNVVDTTLSLENYGNTYSRTVFTSKISNVNNKLIEVGSLGGKVSVLGDLVVCGTLSCVDMTNKPKEFEEIHVQKTLRVDGSGLFEGISAKNVCVTDKFQTNNMNVKNCLYFGNDNVEGSWRVQMKNDRMYFERFDGNEWIAKAKIE